MQKSFWEKFDKDDHAFVIAVILIAGFLILLGIPLLKSDMSLTKELAGIFSGWIVAIIGFYFMRNQTYQIGEMAQKVGMKEGKNAADEMGSVYDELKAKYENTSKKLELITEKYLELRDAYQGSEKHA